MAGEPEDDEQGYAMRRIIAADELAKALGISVDEVFQIARTRQVPWSMTGAYGGFIHEDELDIWKAEARRRADHSDD